MIVNILPYPLLNPLLNIAANDNHSLMSRMRLVLCLTACQVCLVSSVVSMRETGERLLLFPVLKSLSGQPEHPAVYSDKQVLGTAETPFAAHEFLL